jgi:SagB-type dehydrogenase family enzyme
VVYLKHVNSRNKKELKMKIGTGLIILLVTVIFLGTIITRGDIRATQEVQERKETMKLPEPKLTGPISVEQALAKRRSVRDYREDSLTIQQVSQLLWAAQGITSDWGGRTSPSGGALYPLEIFLLAGEVKGLDAGVYRYEPGKHAITQTKKGDLRQKVTEASLDQEEILNAPASIIICAVYERTMGKYGERGIRYVHMEVGSAGENIYLQAESLGLGTVFIGAFEDEEVKQTLGIEEEPLGIMPVGKKQP